MILNLINILTNLFDFILNNSIYAIMVDTSIIFRVRHIGVEHDIPHITARSEIAKVVAVVMIVMRCIANKRKDAYWTPCEMVARMPFAANEDLPAQPVEKDEAVHLISNYGQGYC